MELLLLSNSTLPGEPFFQWPKPYLMAYLQGKKRVAFVPFAAPSDQQNAYVDRVRDVFAELGTDLFGLHGERDPIGALETADLVAVGGGNSFLLLRALYRTNLLRAIADKVKQGLPYLGWSAGSNVACPSIMTTNDMPIVESPSLRAMHLIPFQINPHYTEATIPGHGGESRDQRITEFLALNPDMPVLGLREGALLHIHGGAMRLEGKGGKLFRHGVAPLVLEGGRDLKTSLSGL